MTTIKGNCVPNEKGLKELYQKGFKDVPLIARANSNFDKGKDFYIQYGNALNVAQHHNIDLSKIIHLNDRT